MRSIHGQLQTSLPGSTIQLMHPLVQLPHRTQPKKDCQSTFIDVDVKSRVSNAPDLFSRWLVAFESAQTLSRRMLVLSCTCWVPPHRWDQAAAHSPMPSASRHNSRALALESINVISFFASSHWHSENTIITGGRKVKSSCFEVSGHRLGSLTRMPNMSGIQSTMTTTTMSPSINQKQN